MPIFFPLFRYADIAHDAQGSQHAIEEEGLRELVALRPPKTPLVLHTRKDAHVRFRPFTGALQHVPIRRGQILCWAEAAYLGQEQYPVHLAVTWNGTAPEPWYLLTHLPRASLAVRAYEQRFHCEELFRDLKDQCHVETIRTRKAVCVDHLLFSMVVASHALTLLSAAAYKLGLHLKVCKARVSLAWLALRVLKAALLTPQQLHLALHTYPWCLRTETG